MDYKNIDTSYLEEISEGKFDFIKDIVDIFNVQVDEFLFNFHALYEKKEIALLKKSIHKAKSAFSIIGSHSIVNELKYFEEASNELFLNGKFEIFLESFHVKCDEIKIELDIFLKKNKKC